MKKISLMLAAICFAFGLHASVFAGETHEEPPHEEPPHEVTQCSQGYWKNHTEVWFDVCCDTRTDSCDTLVRNLKARGPGSNILRDAADTFLENCFEVSPCDE